MSQFTLKPLDEVASAEEARDIAVAWQHWQSEQSLSWGEIADYQAYFEQLGQRFDLTEEFQENGIC